MTSVRQIAANRRNARLSTGPKTPAGKARVARNARRHGLTQSARHHPQWARAADELARAIAGPDAGVAAHERAARLASAQVDVMRVRQMRRDLFAAALGTCDLARKLWRIERYERDALARRKFAIRDFDAAGRPR